MSPHFQLKPSLKQPEAIPAAHVQPSPFLCKIHLTQLSHPHKSSKSELSKTA